MIAGNYTDTPRSFPKPEKQVKTPYAGIPKRSKKKEQEIKESKPYYKKAILENIKKNNGFVRCDNCGDVISEPSGRNVHHVVSGGAFQKLYLVPENNFILGRGIGKQCDCGVMFDDGTKRQTMKIYPQSEEIRLRLKGSLAIEKRIRA